MELELLGSKVTFTCAPWASPDENTGTFLAFFTAYANRWQAIWQQSSVSMCLFADLEYRRSAWLICTGNAAESGSVSSTPSTVGRCSAKYHIHRSQLFIPFNYSKDKIFHKLKSIGQVYTYSDENRWPKDARVPSQNQNSTPRERAVIE